MTSVHLAVPTIFVMTSLFLRGALASCTFPETLNMARDDAPWYSHVRADGSRDAEYYIRHNIMEIHYPNADRPNVRWKCTMAFHGKLLLKRQDHLINSFYRCAKVVFRSSSIVQILWSHETKTFDLGLCESKHLVLDPWPLVRYESLELDYSPCPFSAGYNMKITDSQLGESGCNLMLRPMRMEAECVGGEGVTFDFVNSNCLPDINMFVKQRTMCVTHWQDSRNHYVILRRNEDTDLWCLVMPSYQHQGDDVTAYLYSDLVCRFDVVTSMTSKPTPAAATDDYKGLKYFTLQLHKQVFPSLCEDEYPQCSQVSCNSYVKHECHKSCGMCDPNKTVPSCSFPRRFRGMWILKDIDGYKEIDMGDSQLSIHGIGNFRCLQFPDSPERKSRIFTTVSLYANGCRPRYTCIKFRRLGPSVLQYSLSQSYSWPELEQNFGSNVCEEQRFHPDPSPIDDLYRSHAGSGKPIVARFPTPEVVHCNISSVLTVSATLPEGYICSGRLYQHCEDPTRLRLEFGSCGSLIAAHTDYRCLANFEGHYWERIVFVQNLHDDMDVRCFIFSQFYPNEAYAMVASQCDEKSFNFVRGGMREPQLKFEFRSEAESCVSVPVDAVVSVAASTTDSSMSASGLDSYGAMRDGGQYSNPLTNTSKAGDPRVAKPSTMTLPGSEKAARVEGGTYNDGGHVIGPSMADSGSEGDGDLQLLSDGKNGAGLKRATVVSFFLLLLFQFVFR